jgi:hypothetical protein
MLEVSAVTLGIPVKHKLSCKPSIYKAFASSFRDQYSGGMRGDHMCNHENFQKLPNLKSSATSRKEIAESAGNSYPQQ